MLFRKFSKNLSLLLEVESGNLPNGLVACSGGVDSMVLLDLLRRTYEATGSGFSGAGKKLRALYIDHGQRSDTHKDIAVIERYCSLHGIFVEKAKVALPKGASEARMRSARYAVLEAACRPDEILFTAHHAQDQLETFLFRLLRGAHPETIRGIPAKAKRGNIRVFRPLLPFWKAELIDYAKAEKIQWKEDFTNASSKYARNQLRHELLPLLEALRPGSLERVLRFFQDLDNISASVKQNSKTPNLAAQLQNSCGAKISEVEFLDLKVSVDNLLDAESHRTTRAHWDNTRRQLKLRLSAGGGPKKRLEFPGGHELVFDRDRLFWVKKSV